MLACDHRQLQTCSARSPHLKQQGNPVGKAKYVDARLDVMPAHADGCLNNKCMAFKDMSISCMTDNKQLQEAIQSLLVCSVPLDFSNSNKFVIALKLYTREPICEVTGRWLGMLTLVCCHQVRMKLL